MLIHQLILGPGTGILAVAKGTQGMKSQRMILDILLFVKNTDWPNLVKLRKMLTMMYLSIHHFIKICSQEILLNVLRWQYSWGTSGNKTDKSTEQTYMKYLDKSKLRPIAVLLWFRPKECRFWLRFFGRGSEEKLLGQESNLKTPCRLQNSPKCIIWERSGVIWGNLGTIWIDLGMQNHSVSK